MKTILVILTTSLFSLSAYSASCQGTNKVERTVNLNNYYNSCTGEYMKGSFKRTYIWKCVRNNNGYQYNYHNNYKGKLVGKTSGDSYNMKLNSKSRRTRGFQSGRYAYSYKSNLKFVSAGNAENFTIVRKCDVVYDDGALIKHDCNNYETKCN